MHRWDASDHTFMARALRLAERGAFGTHPNPRVGCVLVRDGRIVGEGWHEYAGGPHAEVHALAAAGKRARGATAYVTLEPCGHDGRTPPCSEALIDAGIARVVAAVEDPFPAVSGRGLTGLREAGIKTEVGLLAEEAERLNAGFFSVQRRKRPWVRVKLAASLDGRTALSGGESRWISSEASRRDVQYWRARASAILTGIGTVRMDDPRLDVRIETPRQPERIIVDPDLSLSPDARLLRTGGPVALIGSEAAQAPEWVVRSDVKVIRVPGADRGLNLRAAMTALAEQGVNELHVEAGETLCGALLEWQLVDELMLYVAPHVMGPGRGLFSFQPLESMHRRINFQFRRVDRVGPDLRIVAVPDYPRS